MEDEQPKTKFNAGIAKLQRIDGIKKFCMNARLENDFNTWYKCVKFWRNELNGKMGETEKSKSDTFEYLITDTLTPKLDLSIVGLYSNDYKPKIDYGRANYLLDKYELFLGDIEEKKGIGLINEDDDSGL